MGGGWLKTLQCCSRVKAAVKGRTREIGVEKCKCGPCVVVGGEMGGGG